MESIDAEHEPILTVAVFLVDFSFVSVDGIKNPCYSVNDLWLKAY